MSLLLLFSDQIAASASGDVVTSLLIETAAGAWYDATSDLISGNVTRGKQNQLDRYQAGTAEIILDNDDRKYDPTYASSPLAGYILPMKRVQLRNTYGGVTYPMFAGYADRWTQNRDGPHRGTTSLAATDGFKVLERFKLDTSAYATEVAFDRPVAWYRLGEPVGSTILTDSAGSLDVAVKGTPTLDAAGLVTREDDTAVSFGATTDGAQADGDLPITTAPMTIECVIQTATAEAVNIAGFRPHPGGDMAALVSFTGKLRFRIDAGATSTFAQSTTTFNDNLPHVITGTCTADGTMKVYIDGVDVTSGSSTITVTPFESLQGRMMLGAGNQPETGLEIAGFVGTLDEVSFYDTALSADRILARYQARATAWAAEAAGARVNRILDLAGWPTGDRDVDTGQTTLQWAEPLGMSALEHLLTVADTEFGNLYITAGGVVRFEDRNASVDQAAVFAFSDAAGAGLPVTFSNPEISDEQIRNDVTVSRLEGTGRNARDATSVSTYQALPYVREGLYHDDDDHSRYLAQFILDAYKDPVERVSQMSANPYRDPATLWPAVLGIELTDRITLTETPQWVTPAVTRTLVVEGITHTFGPKSWLASFNLSENTASTQAYWQLGVTGFSELGETTRLFF